MPMPSVEPIPPDLELSRSTDPGEAQDASYLAASERIASLRCKESCGMGSWYVLSDDGASAWPITISLERCEDASHCGRHCIGVSAPAAVIPAKAGIQ